MEPACDVEPSPFDGSWTPLKPVCAPGVHLTPLRPKDADTSQTASTCASSRNSPAGSSRSDVSPRSPRVSDSELGARFLKALPGTVRADGRQMVWQMLHMLRRCGYGDEIVATVLALALVHLKTVYERLGEMGSGETVSIAVMQCFIAHSYVVDEPCPLKCWQNYIYANYCSTKVLNQVAYKLLKLLKYSLRAEDEDLAGQFALLGVPHLGPTVQTV
jgi:hypothetical protein